MHFVIFDAAPHRQQAVWYVVRCNEALVMRSDVFLVGVLPLLSGNLSLLQVCGNAGCAAAATVQLATLVALLCAVSACRYSSVLQLLSPSS